MILDIGCGINPKGTVNVDLCRYSSQITQDGRIIKTKADLISDACFLPFRAGMFDKVYCHHVIEHVNDPALLMKEIFRVLKVGGEADIWCPHRFGKGAKKKFHKWYFNSGWFNTVLCFFPCSFTVSISRRTFYRILSFLPHSIASTVWLRFYFFFPPNEIHVELKKE
jgi:SAM-dependent methyltransferase